MNIPESWKNWIIAIALVIFAGLASATWLYFSSQDSEGAGGSADLSAEQLPVVIQIEDYVLGSDLLKLDFISDLNGTTINQGVVVLGAAVIVAVLIGGLGMTLALITWFGSRQATTVLADESYHESVSKLENERQEEIKELKTSQPTNEPIPDEKRAGWSWFATSLLVIVLVWTVGLLFGATVLEDVSWDIFGLEVNASLVVNLILVLATAILLYAFARRREPAELQSGATDNESLNWGTIWVVVSGLLIFGIGTGLAVLMRSMGS